SAAASLRPHASTRRANNAAISSRVMRVPFRARTRVYFRAVTADRRPDPRFVISQLRELASLTSTPDGAQRLAWGPVWRQAREWFRARLATIGLEPVTD